jgi:F420-non-reducing hydrogenase small subunit
MSNPAKPKIAFYWCASCGGCEEAVVDLAEEILGVLEAVEIVLWPCAMDFKKTDLEGLPDRSINATFLNGAIRTEEQAEMARLLRRKSQLLIAYGACAQLGGIPGLANQFSREEILRYVYEDAPTVINQDGARPQSRFTENGYSLCLPQLLQVVRALDQVVSVDYYLPGCPPTPKLTQAAISALLAGSLPPKGTVLAPDMALCEQCPRKATKPADPRFAEFHRPHLLNLDPEKCFLAQGVVCLGAATRGGCEAACVNGNMPCTGCFGPTSRVRDQGAKALSALCANVAGKDEPAIAQTLAGVHDPVGMFYRYGLAKSLLRSNVGLPKDTKSSYA